ncbi:MAG: phosphomannomutase/phosphoglucomutase [Vampirovibrionales bacterium]|nr:phosphomannomutase/phosphoglucomutase [Vampirovibrionales bacterium]
MGKRSFWGRDDIRAVIDEDFGVPQFYRIGRSYARFIQEQLKSVAAPIMPEAIWIGVGHDARLHSPELVAELIGGLRAEGINVVSLGLSTSPLVYFSEHLNALNPDFPQLTGTLTVTASHNPSEYNGIKFTFSKKTLSEDNFKQLQSIYHAIADNPEKTSGDELSGKLQTWDILPDYKRWFELQFKNMFDAAQRPIKIVVDSGNATAGIVAPDVLRAIGCEVVDIFTEPDGRFPNHHPDPCVHKNLSFLVDKVKETGADFGVAFDGDSDRLGIVDNSGRIVPGDLITLFLSESILQGKSEPSHTVVFDIKASQIVFDYLGKRNGKARLLPSGHAYMKRVMREDDILLGGELSGHLFFRDRHWGFDDALYGACRFIEILAAKRRQQPNYQVSDFIDALPPTRISEEIRLYCSREEGHRLIEQLKLTVSKQADYFGPLAIDVLTIDGLRVNFENGFFLVRASHTEPCLTLRFEAPDENTYRQIESRIPELDDSLKATAS